MKLEREIKLRISSVDEALAVLRRVGAKIIQERLLEENEVLDFEDCRLKRQDELIRLRRFGDVKTLTFKGPPPIQGRVKTREECEVRIDSLESTRSVLQRLGLRPVFRYQKYRRIYEVSDEQISTESGGNPGGPKRILELMLDETPIGNFVELEGDEDLIFVAASLFGRAPGEFILKNYRELYLIDCKRRGVIPRDMVFEGETPARPGWE